MSDSQTTTTDSGGTGGNTRELLTALTALRNGDFSVRLSSPGQAGTAEDAQIAQVFNELGEMLTVYGSEVRRLSRELGTEGRFGPQAEVPGLQGEWRVLVEDFNAMAANLTNQVRNFAYITTAIANGDLAQKITVDAGGEMLEWKKTINVMVDQLNNFASEVTRIAREVGTEGRLGGQAEVKGVSETWKHLTENVNFMAANLTDQVRNIAQVTTAVANGDFSQKITVHARGETLELKNTINAMVDHLNAFTGELTRVSREMGTESKLGGQMQIKGVSGAWQGLVDNVNVMAANLTVQIRSISQVTSAVASGDLTMKITATMQGEMLELTQTVNAMTEGLNLFAYELTRLSREIGNESILGGQMEVEGAAGTWKDLITNVNLMSANLTTQIRAITRLTDTLAAGDTSQRLALETKGEMALLAERLEKVQARLAASASGGG